MGSPVSPIVRNLYMEDFETKALSRVPLPPDCWFRYLDIHIKIKKKHHRRPRLRGGVGVKI